MNVVHQSHQQASVKRPVAIGLLVLCVAILLAVALFVQLSGYHLLTVDRRDQTFSTIISRTVSHDIASPPFVMTYPVTNNQKVDSLIRGYVTDLSNSYLHQATHAPKGEQLLISYQILFYDQKTLSVAFTSQKKHDNSISDTHRDVLVFDYPAGKRLVAGDIVTNMAGLDDILYDYVRTHNTNPTYTNAELIHLLDLQPSDLIAVIPYGDRIAFTFNAHLPPTSGNPETITIDKSVLTGVVAPPYLTVSSSADSYEHTPARHITALPQRSQAIDPNGKKLAITFDDGPGADTPRLLDALRKYRANATFFVIGNRADAFADTLKREVSEGNEIGNHSWNHPNLTKLSLGQIDSQVADTQAAIQRTTGGYAPRLIRPPYGAVNQAVSEHLHGLVPALWTVDTRDWLDKNADIIYSRIMAGAKQNAIILLHDIHPLSVDAAIRAIHDLRADGWQLVTVSQL